MKDLMFIATVKDKWLDFAIAQGLAQLRGNRVVYNRGFHGDHIGRVIIEYPEIKPDTSPPEITKPAVYDERFHVNLRVVAEQSSLEEEKSRSLVSAAKDTEVAWVDPATVATPVREWVGGMDYFKP